MTEIQDAQTIGYDRKWKLPSCSAANRCMEHLYCRHFDIVARLMQVWGTPVPGAEVYLVWQTLDDACLEREMEREMLRWAEEEKIFGEPVPGGVTGENDIPLPTGAGRKDFPISSGVLGYFPDALYQVAAQSKIGNDQHHKGKPLHWDKEKSTDELDALARHLADYHRHKNCGWRRHALQADLRAVAWRALAALQRFCDGETP